MLDTIELPPGEKAQMSLQLPPEFVIAFEPVTHAAHFIDVKGEPTRERQSLSLTYNRIRAPTGTMELRPGPLRISMANRTDVRVLPSVWIAGAPLHDLLGKRKPFLTAKRLLTNQTFRDIYRADTLGVEVKTDGKYHLDIKDDAPTSAVAEMRRSETRRRGDWQVRFENWMRLTCTRDAFRLQAILSAREGDQEVCHRELDCVIPSDLA